MSIYSITAPYVAQNTQPPQLHEKAQELLDKDRTTVDEFLPSGQLNSKVYAKVGDKIEERGDNFTFTVPELRWDHNQTVAPSVFRWYSSGDFKYIQMTHALQKNREPYELSYTVPVFLDINKDQNVLLCFIKKYEKHSSKQENELPYYRVEMPLILEPRGIEFPNKELDRHGDLIKGLSKEIEAEHLLHAITYMTLLNTTQVLEEIKDGYGVKAIEDNTKSPEQKTRVYSLILGYWAHKLISPMLRTPQEAKSDFQIKADEAIATNNTNPFANASIHVQLERDQSS